MPRRIMLTVTLLATLGAIPVQAATGWRETDDARSASARDVYRDNLVGCIGRLAGCDRSRLSQEDRDYLTYEMRDQRFAPDMVRQVADVRMEIYGKGVVPVMGRSTGNRYPETRVEPARASGGSGASGVIGLGKGLGELGGELMKRISIPAGE
jgi:hypothetical protein